MCCNYKSTSRTCCNPFQNLYHSRDTEVFPVTDAEREEFSAYLGDGDATANLCTFCRLQLSRTLHEHRVDDYLLLVDVLSQVASVAQEQQQQQQQQRRNEHRTRAVRELRHQFRELLEARPVNNISPVEKSTPTGIEMLLAAADFVEKNDANHVTISGD